MPLKDPEKRKAYQSAYNRKYYFTKRKLEFGKRKEKGLCLRCPEKAYPGHVYCLKCLNKRRSQKSYSLSTKQKYNETRRRNRQKNRQCISCGEQLQDKKCLCPLCSQKNHDTSLRLRRSEKQRTISGIWLTPEQHKERERQEALYPDHHIKECLK